MFKRLLALFLVVMLVVPAAAIASGKSDTAASKPAGKSLERQDSQAATTDGESEDGDVGTKSKREKGSRAGRAGTDRANTVAATDNDDDDATSTPTNGKLRKPVKRLKNIGVNAGSEDTETRALRKAEKEAKKALKAQRKAEKRMLREERKLGSIDSSGTINNSGTADSTETARGLQRAAIVIAANIKRMVAKFNLAPLGAGTKKAQASLTRVLNKFNTWIELILAGGKKNPGNGVGSDDDTSTPSSGENTSTAT
ncbi:MAG: hypothetical protein QME41_07595 [Actinomycetota bacterium]|nr:hypothetical protein [Actinomycetota bacterium]